MNKRTRFIIAVLLIILICFIAKLVGFWYQMNSTEKDGNISQQSEELDKLNYVGNNQYKIVCDKSGLYGVLDNEDNQIISPQWNSIDFLSDNKFIVSKTENSQNLFGIIDENENIIAPFIYKSIERVSDKLVIGIDKQNLEFILFDIKGTPYINTEWESCSVTNNEINLMKDGNQYTAYIQYDRLIITSMLINTTIKGSAMPALVMDCLPNVDYNSYINIVNLCSEYINSAVNYDTSAIRSLTTADYYNSLISNNILSLVDRASITSITPKIEENEVGFVYSCSINLIKQNDDNADKQEVELIIYMNKGEDGNLFLTSVEKYDGNNIDTSNVAINTLE